FLVNIKDRPDLRDVKASPDGTRSIPGVPNAPVLKNAVGSTRFMGRMDGQGEGPWVYYSERPKGDIIPMHKHSANRTEFLVEGSIEWYEKGKPAKTYTAGTLSY